MARICGNLPFNKVMNMDQLFRVRSCSVQKGLWTNTQNSRRPLNIYIEFTPLNIMFGVLEENCLEINTIILLGKIFVFKAQSRTNFNLSFFKNTKKYLLEKIIATNQRKVALHNTKWEKNMYLWRVGTLKETKEINEII